MIQRECLVLSCSVTLRGQKSTAIPAKEESSSGFFISRAE